MSASVKLLLVVAAALDRELPLVACVLEGHLEPALPPPHRQP